MYTQQQQQYSHKTTALPKILQTYNYAPINCHWFIINKSFKKNPLHISFCIQKRKKKRKEKQIFKEKVIITNRQKKTNFI